ncbi:MAG: hypothetical protein LBG61_05885 [Burkholderiales bacterium]|nr:hypothetical protein [Burkholderiales bacterium]
MLRKILRDCPIETPARLKTYSHTLHRVTQKALFKLFLPGLFARIRQCTLVFDFNQEFLTI